METLLTLAVISFILLFALVAGWVAVKTGKSFRFWFLLSIPLPVIGLCILLCLPEKTRKEPAIEKGKITDHHFKSEYVNPILN